MVVILSPRIPLTGRKCPICYKKIPTIVIKKKYWKSNLKFYETGSTLMGFFWIAHVVTYGKTLHKMHAKKFCQIICLNPTLNKLCYADLNPNFKFRGCLRSIWPLKSHIISFSLRCHIVIAFWHLRLQRGQFVIHLILLL